MNPKDGKQDLQNALDGMIEAHLYCLEYDMPLLADEIYSLYAKVAEESPDEHWTQLSETEVAELVKRTDAPK